MPVTVHPLVDELASLLLLGALLARVSERWGGYELVEHWQQGEFHRSEYRAEFRERQCGGGWQPRR